jgi:hypothetical protein
MAQAQSDDIAVVEALETRLMQETLLVDWSGIDDAPFSPENVKLLLTEPDFAAFRAGVRYAASVVAQQGRESLEAAAKN